MASRLLGRKDEVTCVGSTLSPAAPSIWRSTCVEKTSKRCVERTITSSRASFLATARSGLALWSCYQLQCSHRLAILQSIFQDKATDTSAATSIMDMEIDPEIAAAMGFGSFGGVSKKRKFGADDAFTSQTAAKAQEPQQVASKANAVPVADARNRSRPVETSEPGKCPR